MPQGTPDIAWFRRPGGDGPGTTNLCYNAVDRHVIAGRADEVAFCGPDPMSFGAVLELVAAVAGALGGHGVDRSSVVAVTHESPRTTLLCVLAAARLGAVALLPGESADEHTPGPDAWVTDRRPPTGPREAAVVLLDGPEPRDPTREISWDAALRAGRTDPAGCASVDADATAYVVERRVSVGEALAGGGDGALAEQLSSLASGEAVRV